MNTKRILLAFNVLLMAALACNMPSAAGPLQSDPGTGNSGPGSSNPVVTETPSLTPTVTLTPTSSAPQVTVTSATNCRTGPSTAYDLIYTMQPGQVATLVGKYTPLNYWIINMPAGGTCWLWGQYAVVTGSAASLPDFAPPATPTPSVPADPSSFKVHINCKLNGPMLRYDVHVEMTWQDNASNELGYYLYRNDERISTLGPNETSASDDTVMGTAIMAGQTPEIVYSIEAFTNAGKSKMLSKAVTCFK
jgi:uncharacterized protein YgiM (DUF1202 family)